MIWFWAVAALLTAATVALLGRPLMRRAAAESAEGNDLAVYRDQLAELERDRARGLIEPAEAAPLEAEIGRRMLTAARAAEPALPAAPPARRLTAVVAALFPLCALALYLTIGHPGLPDLPLAARQIAPDDEPGKILAEVEQVKAKLRPVKEDLDRWVTIAEAFERLGRPRDAVDAFRVAVTLAPDNVALSAALAETLIEADGGAVGEEAKQRFQAVPADSPARPEARYYLALADSQAGDMKSALKGWQSLMADSPADAGWVEPTRARIAAAAQALGLDPAKETPTPKPPEVQPPGPLEGPSGEEGPNSAEGQAIARMTPDQQQEMIRGMVAKLAARMEANPGDANGWRQLARAYEVLGDTDKAKNALTRAAQAEGKP